MPVPGGQVEECAAKKEKRWPGAFPSSVIMTGPSIRNLSSDGDGRPAGGRGRIRLPLPYYRRGGARKSSPSGERRPEGE